MLLNNKTRRSANAVRVIFGATLLMLTATMPVRAEQFVFFDMVMRISCKWHGFGGKPNGGFNPDAPRNWITPVNYRDGDYHCLVEVREKTGTAQQAILLAWMNSSENVVQRHSRSVSFTKPGTYQVAAPIGSMGASHWTATQTSWNWEDAYEKPFTETHTASPPFVIRMRYVIVSKGSTYDAAQANIVQRVRLTPNGGQFAENALAVVCSTYTPESIIRYTVDGSDPTESSPACSKAHYAVLDAQKNDPSGMCGYPAIDFPAGTIGLTKSCTVKVRAFSEGMTPSAVTQAEFGLGGALASKAFPSIEGQSRPLVLRREADGSVRCSAGDTGPFRLAVFDMQGRLVRSFSDRTRQSRFFTRDEFGSGVFVAHLFLRNRAYREFFALF